MINRVLRPFGYTLYRDRFHREKYMPRAEFRPMEQLFHRYMHPGFFFIQIGANDGVYKDPVYPLVTRAGVGGILVEPLPDLFSQLRENYAGHPRVELVNMAIHRHAGEMDLYRVDPRATGYPEWVKGIASFRKDHHQLSGVDPGDMIITRVPCLSLEQLLTRYRVERVDLLQVDTEGYDLEILKMIDFNRIRPSIISFEHGVREGIMTRSDFRESTELLLDQGYHLIILQHDAIAYLESPGPR
jgi:FkbM family methyltransferase